MRGKFSYLSIPVVGVATEVLGLWARFDDAHRDRLPDIAGFAHAAGPLSVPAILATFSLVAFAWMILAHQRESRLYPGGDVALARLFNRGERTGSSLDDGAARKAPQWRDRRGRLILAGVVIFAIVQVLVLLSGISYEQRITTATIGNESGGAETETLNVAEFQRQIAEKESHGF